MDCPQDTIRKLIDGYRQSALIGIACQSGLLDILDGLESRKATASQIAAKKSWCTSTLRRILRGLELIDVVELDSSIASTEPLYKLTEAGRLLTGASNLVEGSYARLSFEQYFPAWGSLSTDQLSTSSSQTKTPFETRFGMGVWEYRRENKAAGERFNQWLSLQTNAYVDQIVAAFDLGETKKLMDIGGGTGALLRQLLIRNPKLYGGLADQDSVLQQARESKNLDFDDTRLGWYPTNFFESIPSGFDKYCMKSVLHDWNDQECLRILKTIRQAMAYDSKLVVIERLIPDSAKKDPATIWLDLHMLCVTGGRERTIEEYHKLFAESGLIGQKVTATSSPFYLIEAGCG